MKELQIEQAGYLSELLGLYDSLDNAAHQISGEVQPVTTIKLLPQTINGTLSAISTQDGLSRFSAISVDLIRGEIRLGR
jgi:hypothetical protein